MPASAGRAFSLNAINSKRIAATELEPSLGIITVDKAILNDSSVSITRHDAMDFGGAAHDVSHSAHL